MFRRVSLSSFGIIFNISSVKILSQLLVAIIYLGLFSDFSRGQSKTFTLPAGITEKDYDPYTIVVKLTQSYQKRGTGQPGIGELSAMINASKFKKAIPGLTRYQRKSSRGHTDLSTIYKIIIEDTENLEAKINRLLAQPNVVYAEPYYLPRPLFIPDDPAAAVNGSQTYLSIIRAYEGWEFEKGDSTVVIGILDTGVDLSHEDLTDNIFYNPDDPINGIDDDGDGYVDNYHGWDFANNDHDPTADFSQHGTSVAGISSARTNNGKGMAGVGFKTRFLPVKIFNTENNAFNNGYEAILYAAGQGCKVINLSWGIANTFSNYARDIINFAVLDMDVVVVAAAGNTNAELNFYPASYENVLSVGASDYNDQKAGFATYSHFIDVMAPGAGEYTTKNGNTYGISTGSSFASPMVAGVAALVRSRYPDLNARQVMEKIRLTADNIYAIPGNESYFEKLGHGRVNLQRAIAPDNKPAIRMTDLAYNNNVGPYATNGSTVNITMRFINLLNSTANASATLTCSSPFVTIVEDNFNIGGLTAMEEKNNDGSPFIIQLASNTPPNETLSFRIGYEDVNYSDYQYFELVANPDYINLDNGKISLAVANDGNLAYTDGNLENGGGFIFKGERLLDHMGIALATASDKVADNIIFNFNTGQKNQDFAVAEPLQFMNNSIAPIDVRSTFTDSNAPDPAGLRVTQKILSADADTANSFIIAEYRITNLSGNDLPALYTGMYTDWDIGQYTNNAAAWDQAHKLGYIHDKDENDQFAGIALITGQEAIYNAIDLADENGNTADFSQTLSKMNKFDLLTASTSTSAGALGAGNDVAQLLSGKTLDLKNNQSTRVAFVMAVEESLASLQNTITTAAGFYASYLQNPPVSETFDLCRDQSIDINPSAGLSYRFYADADTTQFLSEGEFYTTGPLTEDRSYYIVNTDQAYAGDIEQVKVVIKEPQADFLMSSDTVYLDENMLTAVEFSDLTLEGASWDWDFGNGFFSSKQNPVINFTDEGVYDIKLKVETMAGCIDSATMKMVVVTRGPRPDIPDFQICPGDPVILQAANATNICLYRNEDISSPVEAANSIIVENLKTDTTFYVTNKDSLYESLPAEIRIDVSEINASFNYSIDSLALNEKTGVIFSSLSPDATSWSWHVDQLPVSDDSQFKMQPSEEKQIAVTLVTSNSQGCRDTVTQVISFQKSPRPPARQFRFCKGQEVFLNLPKDNFYNFYEDEGLSRIIGKGSTLDLGDISVSKRIYYTALDALLEGDSNTIDIQIVDKFADFELSQENIYLDQTGEVAFEDLSPFSVSRQWYLDGKLVSSDSAFSQQFNAPGNYSIKLQAQNDIGCIDSLEKSLRVLLVTGLPVPFSQKSIAIYPNPSEGIIFMDAKALSEHTYQLQVFNQLGISVLEKTFSTVDIENGMDLQTLPSGTYYLTLLGQNSRHFVKKLVVQKK